MSRRMESQQTTMHGAWREAEAAQAGRWNDLSLALSRIGTKCDLHLSRFVRLVFDMTKGGTEGELIKSHRALSERPLWLCCSERKVGNTVRMARDLGFVTIRERTAYTGSQQENAYTINWEGVRNILAGARSTTCAPPSTTCQGVGTTYQGPSTTCQRNKEEKLLGSFIEEFSGTGPETVQKPADGASTDQATQRKRLRWSPPSTIDLRMDDLLMESPILKAAVERRIAPLPASSLVHGVYAVLEEKHLREPLYLVRWHRRQLSTTRPVMGNTEADLLLVIASAMYAIDMREMDVQRTRVAVFVGTIVSRNFLHSRSFVPQARKFLDSVITHKGVEWVGIEETVEVAQ